MANLDRDYYLDRQGLRVLISELETNIVAEEFSTSATYDLGDYCIYDNLLYICIAPVTTAGSWTGNANWLQVLLADELSEKTEIQTITLAQWESLTPEQKASGDYVISDATLSPLSASLMPYDNTTSGLTADDVQEAIDELAQGSASSMAQLTDVKLTSPQNGQELVYDNTLTSPYKWENRTTRVELTQAQYDALANPLPDVDYYITDAPSMQGSAQDLSYDGTTLSTYNKIEGLNASNLPITSGSATNTKAYIDGKTGSDIEWEANAGVSISSLIRYLLMTEQADLNSSINIGTATPRITYYSSTATNRPSGNSGVVITQGSQTYRQQMAIDLEGNIFARYYNNGTISSWVNRVGAVSGRVDKLEKTTVSATKGSTMPSGFPATPSAITRCGAMVTVQFGQQIPAGTYTAQQTLWTMNPAPRNIARAVVQTGAYYNIINILGSGEIRFNGTLTFDSAAWLIGQITYITALS